MYIYCSARSQSDESARVKSNNNIREQIHSKAAGNTKPDMPYAMTTTGKKESRSPYQQLTSSTLQKKGDYEYMQQGFDGRGGLGSQSGQVILGDQIYDTCT